MDCAKLTANIMAKNCNMPQVEVESRIILINKDDIDTATSTIAGGVISNLALKDGAKGVEFLTNEKGVSTENTFSRGTYFGQWDQKVIAKVFRREQDIKDAINSLMNSKMVVIVENRESGAEGATKYEAYGYNIGLKMTEATSTSTDGDKVIYSLSLGTSDTEKESQLPMSVYKTSAEATKSMIDSLLVASKPTV